MKSLPLLTIYTDGASRGNPGAAAYAYTIARPGYPPIEEADCLGEMTNNQAEYTALICALERAKELGADHNLLIHSDSELMVKQMNGAYQVKKPELIDLFKEARELADAFTGTVRIVHVRREQNRRTDALCNEALDGKRVPTPRAVSEPAPPLNLADAAVHLLRDVEVKWRRGEDGPSAKQVWADLWEVLERHGITEPAGGRR
jgi:ribonuclease HI